MVNVFTSCEHEARKKQRCYENRMRAEPKVEWSKITIITAFFNYKLEYGEFPPRSALQSKDRPQGFPCISTIDRYASYEEVCDLADERYRRYRRHQRHLKVLEIFGVSQEEVAEKAARM